MREKIRKTIAAVATLLAGPIVLAMLSLIGMWLYLGSPFSIYFLTIFLLFVIARLLSKRINRHLVSEAKTTSVVILFTARLIDAFCGVLRVMCFSALPIVVLQTTVRSMERDWRETTWMLEGWMFDLHHAAQSMNLQIWLSYALIGILLVAVFAHFKRFDRIDVRAPIKAVSFGKGFLFFVGFSFFTTIGVSQYEADWRAERRADVVKYEQRLVGDLNREIIYQSIALSPELQKEFARLISTAITLVASYELIRPTLNAVVTTKLKSTNFKAAITQLERPSNAEIAHQALFKNSLLSNRKHKDIQKYAYELRQATWGQSSRSGRAERDLRDLISEAVKQLVPDIPSGVVQDAVLGAVEGLSAAKYEYVKSSSGRIRALTLYAHLTMARPDRKAVLLPEEHNQAIIRLFDDVDRKFITDIERYVLDTQLYPKSVTLSWDERFRDWRRSAAKAIPRAL